MPSWDPQVYGRYAAERSRPFIDLMARVAAESPQRVVDLGCGNGELTASLARRWPDARVLGVDSSPQMLERAAAYAAAPDVSGRLRFIEGDVAHWEPEEPIDVLVTNAVLQWLPDHLPLLERWARALAPGGWLALQVPGNHAAPSHALMREVAAQPRFSRALAGVLRGSAPIHDAVGYAERLAQAGCTPDAWETTYIHVLDPEGKHGDNAVLAWMQGTGLRPVTDTLAADPELCQAFLDDYSARLRRAYPHQPWGTPLHFRRVFCVARKAGA